jgi:hypothetical protein
VTSVRFGEFIGRGCSTAPRLRLDVPQVAPAVATKGMHPLSGISGTNADLWPLSPEDWSTG